MAAADDAPGALAAATAGATAAQLEACPANSPLRFFFAARSWCVGLESTEGKIGVLVCLCLCVCVCGMMESTRLWFALRDVCVCVCVCFLPCAFLVLS